MIDKGTLVKRAKSKYASLDQVRQNHIPLWTDIRNYLAPRTAYFQGEKVDLGGRQDLNIINCDPRDAIRTLGAGLQSGVTSPIRPWFRLGLPDPDLQEYKPVKVWLYMVERIMRDVMSRSNFYDRVKSNYAVLGCYGTSALSIEEDDETIIRAFDYPIGSFMIAQDAAQRVRTLMRDVQMTADQMIGKFAKGDMKLAKEILPASVLAAYDKGNYDYLYPIIHTVDPNPNYKMGSQLSGFKKMGSLWIDPSRDGEKAIYLASGFEEMPFMAPRWDLLGANTYGNGCGEMAIGDSKGLQKMELRKYQGIDKNVRPPMIADASMRSQRQSHNPGDTTYVNGLITGRPGYQPAYQVNPYISELREEIMSVSQRIDRAFYKNLFLMVSEFADQPNITATQINTLREEKLLMLGPVLERLNDELLDPGIDRIFNICMRKGMFPEPPPEIQGMPLRIEYVSILAQAQKALGIGNIERFVGFVGNLASVQAANGQKPTALDKLNFDQAIDEYGEGVAVPPTIIFSDDEVAQTRAASAQQDQQMQAMQMAGGAADIAHKMSQSDMTGTNALTKALELAGGSA